MSAGAWSDDPLRELAQIRLIPTIDLDALENAPGLLLDPADVERYGRIFDLQEAGMWAVADGEIAQLADTRLMGHVLFQRYFHPDAYTSSFAELRDWLAAYSDLPQAARVYELAQQRRPAGAAAPQRPTGDEITGSFGWLYGFQRCGFDSPGGTAREVRNRLRDFFRDDAPSRALDHLEGRRGALSAVDFDALLAEVSASYYFEGVYDRAFEVAARAVDGSGDQIYRGNWIAGLAAWRRGDWAEAAGRFAAVADEPCASPWWRSGGAYWAARADIRSGNPAAVSGHLRQASAYPHTFYGLIALRALGAEPDFNFSSPAMGQQHWSTLTRHQGARRAIALIQVGRPDLAEQELLRLPADHDDVLGEALVALAAEANLPELGITVGTIFERDNRPLYDSALYPLAHWQPTGGWRIDQALVHAIIRNESRFETDAVSYAGAVGLMQIIPSTARAVAGYTVSREELNTPAVNLSLGQDYIADLLDYPTTARSLFHLLIGYNAGAGNLERWLDQTDMQDDPLLLVESIPSTETRAYLERVSADYWIYRLRLGQATPSLDDVVAGQWPRYVSQDRRASEVALHGTD
ncbi:MAG: lytic transglycosylase domain-containing protein [Azospirillaceae bacterium]